MNRGEFKRTRNIYICISVVLLTILVCVFIAQNGKNKPIIIGFSAQLTGRQAELGVQERNGVQLAVKKINEEGGIGGRKISLIIHDDFGKATEAANGDRELIKDGAVAIIGHATSSQTMQGLQVTNGEHVVMIGPTVSTPELSGLDDYFFRVYPSFKSGSEYFAKYIYETDGISRMAIIYDIGNYEYAKTYSSVFANKFKSLGGEITDELNFTSEVHPDFLQLLSKLRESNAEGLLIVASDIDTAFIAQRVRLMGWQIPMYSSDWAQTETLINNGGKAVEGMKLEQAYSLTSNLKEFTDFQSKYESRFSKEPSFGAAFSYEATLVLAEALKKTNGNKDGLKEALLEIQNYRGIMNSFSFDKYGDVERPWYLSTVKDGKFVVVDKVVSKNSGGSK